MQNLEYFPESVLPAVDRRPSTVVHYIRCYGMGFLFQSSRMKQPSSKSMQTRKEKLAERLQRYELDNTISDPDSFDHTRYNYIDPTKAAERLLILLAVSFTAYDFAESEKVMNWLKMEELWQSVSDKEKEFFRDPDPSDEEKQVLSWRFEAAYVLAWCLEKIEVAPKPEAECGEQQVADFFDQVPAIGTSTNEFFTNLRYRSLPKIVDETLFYQVTEKYFRDLAKKDKENTSSVNAKACVERFKVLSWLTSDNQDWDLIGSGKDDTRDVRLQ
jgi:Domain of unknown function (DUF4272)